MTQMQEKLKTAGVALTQMQRLWMKIKDYPNKTAKELRVLSGVQQGSIFSLLAQMERRNMVQAQKDMRIWRDTRRSLKVYSTNLHEYELLPVPYLVVKPSKPHALAPAAAPGLGIRQVSVLPLKRAAPDSPSPVEVEGLNDVKFIDNLTVGQARLLYQKLRGMFGQ